MAQSEEELLPITDAANYLKKSEAYVLAKLRRRQFQRVIIEKRTSTGARWTAHCYFDKKLWPFTDDEEIVIRDHEGNAITYTEGKERKEVRRRIVKDFSGKEYDAIKGPSEEHCTVVYDPSVDDYFYLHGPNDMRNEAWLDDSAMIYIPLATVEAFQQEHGPHREVNPEKAYKRAGTAPVPDVSEITPERWYNTFQAARYLGVTQKHLQNNLIDTLSNKKKIGTRWHIQGRGLIAYLKQYVSDR